MPHAHFETTPASARRRQPSGFGKPVVSLAFGLFLLLFPMSGYAQPRHQAEESTGWLTVMPDVSADGFAADIQVSAVTSEAQPFRVTYVQTRNLTKRRPAELQLDR
ncbi:MAG: hypothetical protein SNJ67_13430, partial [Chloracidobacterium sp.]